jgi:hypothetical protein
VIRALEEERALLREDEREATVDVDLQRVGLDLAEVGIVRGVKDQRARDAQLQVAARLLLRLVVPRSGAAGVEQLARVEPRAEHVRLERQLAAAARAVQAVEVGALQHDRSRLADAVERPCRDLVPRRQLAAHPDAPRPASCRDAEDAERHRQLGGPLGVAASRRRIPHAIPFEVGVGGQDAVHLHAVGVDAEDVRALAVAVGVHVHRDVVAVQHAVARGEARVGLPLRLAPDAEHQPVAVAQHAHGGGFVGGFALARRHELELARHRRRGPGGLVERAVQPHRARRHAHGERAAFGGQPRGRQAQRQRDGGGAPQPGHRASLLHRG